MQQIKKIQEKRVLTPTYFMSSILLVAIIHFIFPITKLLFFPWNLLGLLLLALGGLLNLLPDRDFRRFNTTVKPFEYSSKLITSGVFRLSRNPMYLGMGLFLLGESMLFGSLGPFIIPIGFVVLMHFIFIIPEEKMLSEKFGEEYETYRKKVRRWI
jgi:protein-S-isoprenylcysteine O-methyltransferase Ste14